MITVIDHQIYSTGGEIAYQLEYSDGSKFRTVEGNRIIRTEYLSRNGWVQSGKPYVVAKNKKRQAERIKDSVINALR